MTTPRYALAVVDDHRFIRESIIKSIDWEGLGVEISGEASNGVEAEALVLRKRPDIVVTDIRMPGIEGLDLVERLHQLGFHGKVIVITGFQEFEYAQRALKLDVVDLVLKPIKNEELVAAVRKAIAEIEREAPIADSRRPPEPGAATESYGLMVDSILAYIDRHYAEDLTLNRIAEEFKLNASYVSRIVAKGTGSGFVQQVNRRRIAVAERLLEDPSTRIKEIVSACGFSDYSYFLKIFRSIAGCTPQQYRDRLAGPERIPPQD
jgi:two-component system, response regulator YesN